MSGDVVRCRTVQLDWFWYQHWTAGEILPHFDVRPASVWSKLRILQYTIRPYSFLFMPDGRWIFSTHTLDWISTCHWWERSRQCRDVSVSCLKPVWALSLSQSDSNPSRLWAKINLGECITTSSREILWVRVVLLCISLPWNWSPQMAAREWGLPTEEWGAVGRLLGQGLLWQPGCE